MLAVYVYLCNLQTTKLSAHRYLYVAVKETALKVVDEV
jgi:hypothetical protein